eukprot:TRINITY_DN1095_c0_g1_i3.p1 TRINITY_DN1095_c0_g1~~TRINITY_DN1095_c0_g1_i3.p1  ORF type:complete len:404 (+),score=73.36 TRINITY_DN1095_c0_g1_i3:285-1496(+)
MEAEQKIIESYQEQERHHLMELEKVETRYSDSNVKILRQYLQDELDRTSEEMIAKLGSSDQQTLRHKLRFVRIEHITSQLIALQGDKVDEQSSPEGDGVSQEKPWPHGATVQPSPSVSSSTVSCSSLYRPRHKDQPASEVSAPHSQISSDSSLPRPNLSKVKTETMQDIFKKLQNNLRPNTTIPKIRSNKHQRSSSVNKINMDPSPDVTRPSRPTPVCPNRSQSFTGPRLSMAARNTSLPGLSVSTDKAGINLALYSMNSSEGVTPRTSFLSDSAEDMKPDSPEPSDFITSLLAKYDTDPEAFACTLEAITRSHNHIKLLFSKGIVEKCLQLLHGVDENWRFVYHSDIRVRIGEALDNIIRHIYRDDMFVLQIHCNVGRVRDQWERMLASIHRDNAAKLIDVS